MIVRKRPSRSTSASPIGRMSSIACRLGRARQRQRVRGCRTGRRCRCFSGAGGSSGICTPRSGCPLSPSAVRWKWPSSSRRTSETNGAPSPASPPSSAREPNARLQASTVPSPSTSAARMPARRQLLARLAVQPAGGKRQRIVASPAGEAPQQQVAARADPLDLDRDRARRRGDAGSAAGAVAPRHRHRDAERLPAIVVLAEPRPAAARRRTSRDRRRWRAAGCPARR